MYKWSRKEGYQVSSKGDTRFSALYAKLKDGRTIEQAYQLDVKGYRQFGDNFMLGKGKPPLTKMTEEELYASYLNLWKVWAGENSHLMNVLEQKAKENNYTLGDYFANTQNNQARALADILNERKERATMKILQRNVDLKNGKYPRVGFMGEYLDAFGSNLDDYDRLEKMIKYLADKCGSTDFMSNFTTGFSSEAAQIVAYKLEEDGPRLHFLVPYEGLEYLWYEDEQTRYYDLMATSQHQSLDQTHIIMDERPRNSKEKEKAFLEGGKYMVDWSDLMVILANEKTGVARETLNYARSVDKPILLINTQNLIEKA